jgi:hypothetical protein
MTRPHVADQTGSDPSELTCVVARSLKQTAHGITWPSKSLGKPNINVEAPFVIDIHRQTDSQTDKQTDRQTNKKIDLTEFCLRWFFDPVVFGVVSLQDATRGGDVELRCENLAWAKRGGLE